MAETIKTWGQALDYTFVHVTHGDMVTVKSICNKRLDTSPDCGEIIPNREDQLTVHDSCIYRT